jgi:hypothetical protein
MGVINPRSERQARILACLDPDQQIIAWQKSASTAPNGKVTGVEIVHPVGNMTTTGNRIFPL